MNGEVEILEIEEQGKEEKKEIQKEVKNKITTGYFLVLVYTIFVILILIMMIINKK